VAKSNELDDTDSYLTDDKFADKFFAPAGSPLFYSFGAASHAGKVRPNNEDHFAVVERRRSSELLLSNLDTECRALADDSVYCAVVADGMGGERFGEFASRLALETMFHLARNATSWVMKFTDFEAQQIRQRVKAYVQEIQKGLKRYVEADPALAGMGTTWTSALCLGRDVLVVHLGDSRCYTLRQQELRQITHDETVAQAFVDAGKDAVDVKQFRHLLLNHFGGDKQEVTAQIHHVRLEAGDRLLLCTDGLTDMVGDDEISQILQQISSPQAASDNLVARALDHGGKDNVTAVVAAVRQ
jgi:PPM family protein phosphatase